MVGAVAVPIVCLLVGAPGAYVVASSAVAVFAVVRHKSNIQRLRSGTENRFRLKKS
jgi:glycerol-3-phosphate acyltransferase PlsY